ncbi:MAG TPA: radical SAM family heme chaperone HemW [Gemmatimonadaceae bacterium]|jgi:oxygen-independent coproporphyrinogen-3 oxidase|nr:radical SAM family heme chaperone HemW [Gemmatimonadaceae bacterium]
MPPRHVYVHVPFCARRCSYCDFSIAVRRSVPVDEYLVALERELARRVPRDERWTIDTLYVGGGTPSQLGADGVARMLDLLTTRFALEPDAEVTLEANPDDISLDGVRRWRSAGVNRLSIGSQSFDPRVLDWMHRTHSAEQITQAVAAARAGGIENLSLDLIFALPQELGRDWDRDLEHALALAPQHLSFYGLTIEPTTPLARWRDRGEVREAPEERYESEFLRAHDLLARAGYEHYEVSNYARPGKRSRHNSSYWRRVPYAGFGPAAHEFDGVRRRWNIAPYAGWVRAVHEGRDPLEADEVLGDESRRAEEVYLGLRVAEGVDIDEAMALRVQPWVDAGWAELDASRLRLTPAGWLRLDALAADLTLIASRC